MNKDFKLFQEAFKKYQKLFGLTGYKVYFKNESIEGAFANITINQHDMVATVRLCSDNGENGIFKHIERSAKHEALHLLLYELEDNAYRRFLHQDDINESTESIVVKLEELIPDIKE